MDRPYKGCRFDYVLHLPENLYQQLIQVFFPNTSYQISLMFTMFSLLLEFKITDL